MSELKYKSVEELKILKANTESNINKLQTQLAGEHVRLEWINRYIFEKTPKEMTIEEIERALGHKIIIK